MVSQCANPRCGVPFRYLHEGKVFMVERKNGNGNHNHGHRAVTKLEYFWLCSECASHLTLQTELGIVRVAETTAARPPLIARR
jgi:hypothetical protein